ncbi:DUF6460 domain-containing protein [Roseibium aggregatum]|uniref:DUF6460 domain-containing protein n=1 Tax=Roseibium aggregatum TaxID=187304 RepID=A0A926S5I1_9HYPH|nr:DUF6460 domain-containing protein [Roseibium aggregatum]MBD1546190.1 hypothetical protein [Roseibium aggregatum]
MIQFLSTIFKIALASLIVGAILTFFNISAETILNTVGLSPMQLWIYLQLFIDWAIPNILLGAFIVVPVWLLIYVVRPPRA